MSIYCSFGVFDEDDRLDDDSRRGPIVYQGSHVLPSPDSPRGGSLDLGYIPGWITRNGSNEGRDPGEEGNIDWWPYLRVGLIGGEYDPNAVVLDVDQVGQLIDDLTSWRDRVRRETLSSTIAGKCAESGGK